MTAPTVVEVPLLADIESVGQRHCFIAIVAARLFRNKIHP